jgi:hypothetical protein
MSDLFKRTLGRTLREGGNYTTDGEDLVFDILEDYVNGDDNVVACRNLKDELRGSLTELVLDKIINKYIDSHGGWDDPMWKKFRSGYKWVFGAELLKY